jgi:uncharacterized protein (DUF1697 family)
MAVYIAFLRAINVGGHTVKMDHLRSLFEALGFSNVETFIASGNVIFETKTIKAASLEKKIAPHLEEALGYKVDAFIRTLDELIEIEKRCPFETQKKDDMAYVSFLHEPLNAEKTAILMSIKNKFNDFAPIGNEIYWLRLNKDDSIFLKNSLEKILKITTTNRNMTTIRNIVEKYNS